MDKLVNELTQKDENRAIKAATEIVEQKNIQAFGKLCEKSDFLFDFVKDNVCKRFEKVINESNHKNLFAFFDLYNESFSPVFVECLAKFADEELTDEVYELLENGTVSQKKYAAKYFQFIPDTIAQDLLRQCVFSDDIELSINASQALGKMQDDDFYNSVIEKLCTNDEFELMKSVRFLSAFGNKSAIKPLLNILETTPMAENIAAEIPYLESFTDMIKKQDKNKVLTCFDFVLSGLGEIFNLSDIFFYEVYDILAMLIEEQNIEPKSQIAQILLRAFDKFTMFTSNDEYSFDETKDTKEELRAIFDLLNSQPKNFWIEQKNLIAHEFLESKQRIIATLETIQSLNIVETKGKLIDFINSTIDEQLIVLAVGVANSIGAGKALNYQVLSQKVTDSTLKVILNSYNV